MTIWVVLAAIIVGVLLAVLAPLLRRSPESPSRRSREIAIYRDQLAELQREVEAGRILPAEAKMAETEVQRKILAAAESVDPAEANAAAPRRWFNAAALVLVAAILPTGALVVYLQLGSPTEPAHPFDPVRAAAQAKSEEQAREMAVLVDRLAERLAQEPDNIEGWVILARSYGALQRHVEAAAAYERVYELSGGDVRYAGDYAEALVAASGRRVTSAAQALFKQVVDADPTEPRARFYLALARAQAGQAREAIAMWRSLERDSPADAQWLPTLREMIRTTAAQWSIDPESVPAQPPAPISQAPGPTAEDLAAAESMSPEEQEQMIRNMVAGLAQRLEANPEDLDGWKRLGRSYLVLEDPASAKRAYGRAVALAPTDLTLLGDYANASLLADGTTELPPQSIEALRQLLKTDAANPAALWLVGLTEAQAGNRQRARDLWESLLTQLPPDSSAHRSVRARIVALETGN
jgi:cytochrome c-type biogenesis protein CcmH